MRKTFDDIAYIWKSGQVSKLPSADEIVSSARKGLSKIKNKIIVEVASLSLALITIIWVCSIFRFQYLSTYIGLGLMFLTVAGFSFFRIRQVLFLRKINVNNAPKDYSADLKQFQLEQKKVNTTYYTWYVILLNFAFGLYFYEVLFRSGLRTIWQYFAVIIYIAWMLIAIFYIKLIKSRKEEERVKQVIQDLEKLQDTLSEESQL